jgi:hypothetical protein
MNGVVKNSQKTRKKKPPPRRFKEEFIEKVPDYPYKITLHDDYLKKYPIKIPRIGEYVQSYKEDEKTDPYLYMGILYKYSLRLQKEFEKYGPVSLNIIINRYKQLLESYISIPYLEKPKNIVYKIFMNTIHNQLHTIQKTKIDIKENLLIRIEFNKKIRNDIKHLSELIISNNIREYKLAFASFNQMYLTDGIMEMLNEIYKKNTNSSNYVNMHQLKLELFKKNENISTSKHSSRRTQSLKKQQTPIKTIRTTRNSTRTLLNIVPGQAI